MNTNTIHSFRKRSVIVLIALAIYWAIGSRIFQMHSISDENVSRYIISWVVMACCFGYALVNWILLMRWVYKSNEITNKYLKLALLVIGSLAASIFYPFFEKSNVEQIIKRDDGDKFNQSNISGRLTIRFAATLFDLLIVAITSYLLGKVEILANISTIIGYLFVFIIMSALTKRTIGMTIMKIRYCPSDISISVLIKRHSLYIFPYLIYKSLTLIPFIATDIGLRLQIARGYLVSLLIVLIIEMVHYRACGAFWHDRISNVYIIKKNA